MKCTLMLLIILFSSKSFTQKYTLSNEENIISFTTQKGKIVTLSKDKNNDYIVYRFGTKDKIELEYPEKNKNSWDKFKFSFYHRGGGKENTGMELDNVWFTIDDYEYGVFSAYRAEDEENEESYDVGVKVLHLKTGKETQFMAVENSVKGSLTQFRDNNLLEMDTDRIDYDY